MAGGLDTSITDGWLPSLPPGWSLKALRWTSWIRARLGWKGLTAAEYVTEGVPLLSTPDIKTPDISYSQANRVTWERYDESPEIKLSNGDVLLTKDGATIGIVNLVADLPEPATVNGSIAVLTPGRELSGRYLRYCLSSEYAQQMMALLQGGMGVPHLFQADIKRMRMPVPPLTEQQIIADYLDHETALIDELIERQKALVERLRERRAAVTEEAFNCTGPRAALGHYVSTLPGFAFGSEGFSADTSDVPLLRGVNIKPDGITWEQAVYWPREQLASVRRYVLSEGDVVLGLDRPFVSGGTRVQRLGPCDAPSLLLQRVVKLIPHKMDPDFLTLVLQSRAFREYAEPEFTGVSVPHLSDKQVRDFRCPVPPPEQQRTIAADILNRTARIDALIAKTERHIELAKERRSALITAAVTGQIDTGAA